MIIGQLPGILWYCSHKAKKESKYFDLSLDGIVERKTFWKIMNKTLADTWQGLQAKTRHRWLWNTETISTVSKTTTMMIYWCSSYFLYSIATTTSKTIWTLMTFDVWNKHFSGEQIGRASVTLNLFVHSFSTNWETFFGAKFKIYDFLRSPLAPPHNKNKSFSPNQLIGFPFTERERERAAS